MLDLKSTSVYTVYTKKKGGRRLWQLKKENLGKWGTQ